MMEAKNKILSFALILCLMLGMLPTVASAASSGSIIDLSDTTTASGDGWTYSGGIFNVTGDVTITGTTTTSRIKVQSGVSVNITLNSADIQVAGNNECAFDMSGATVNLTLEGTNTLTSGASCAGLQVPSGATLIIDGTGSLTATGSANGAGIGGGNSQSGGNITITNGTIIAYGKADNLNYDGGAGIGGGSGANGGNITITGGDITAAGGGEAAGIGAGSGQNGGRSGGNITITGGNVAATGGNSAAGIGGGYLGAGGNIVITGGTVTAGGGDGDYSMLGAGAGIGGGGGSGTAASGASGSITIAGTADVTATGGDGCAQSGGAGIGSGGRGSTNVAGAAGDTENPITITVTVIAVGGNGGNGRDGATIGKGGGIDGTNAANPIIPETNVTQHTITAGADVGGSISPTGSVSVIKGANQIFTVTANTGYVIDTVKVDNTPQNITNNISFTFVLPNVTSGQSIAATFIQITSITSQPDGQSVTEGDTATFTVAATGDSLSYQWQVDKNDGSGFVNVTDGTGGTAASYTTPITITTMSGWTYRAVVSNAVGTVTSSTATLTVNEAATPVVLSAGSPANGTVDVAYAHDLSGDASGGVTPYTFALDSGSLPDGLNLSSAGVINGTPTDAGDFNFTVKVTDSKTPTPQTDTATYSITINEAGTPVPPTVTPTTLELDVYSNSTATVNISLGMSCDGVTPPATKATASSSDDDVATAPDGDLTGTVTITAHSEGTAVITFTFDDDGGTTVDVAVIVADSTPSTPGNHDPINPPTEPINPASDTAFTFAGDYADLLNIYLNGNLLTKTNQSGHQDLSGYPNYISVLGKAEPGSVKVTLYKAFLATLPDGRYTLTATFADGGQGVLPFDIERPVNPPVNNGSGSSDSGSGGSSGVNSVKAAPSAYIIDTAAMRRLIATADKNGWDFVRASSALPTTVKGETWKLLGDRKFTARTTADGAVQVQLTFPEPSKLTADMKVSGYVKGTIVDARKAFFEKWFTNRLQVIHLEQTGSFGQAVEVAAKVDLSGMDTANLCFYSYDKASNSYKRIEKPGYWIDKNGYLHFITELAGDIIISDGALTSKGQNTK